MKKIILLVISILFLTGCNVEYNLNISEDVFYENINIISETENESNIISSYLKPIEAFINSPMHSESIEKLPDVEYYNSNKLINNGLYNLNLNYYFDINEFKNANIINHSVSIFKFTKKNNEYNLNTGARLKIFDSYDINNLTIKITLDEYYEYVNSNADNIFNNEYTWYINKDNYKTRPINFSFKVKKDNNTGVQNPNNNNTQNNNQNININEKNNSNDLILIVCLLMGFIFVITMVLTLSKKVHK